MVHVMCRGCVAETGKTALSDCSVNVFFDFPLISHGHATKTEPFFGHL